jgi:predicted dehydrogenase
LIDIVPLDLFDFSIGVLRRYVIQRSMKMADFRYGIIGAGHIAGRFCTIDGVKIVAVGSKSVERAEKFAFENGIHSSYGNYEEMLHNEKLDAVYIATTNNFHFENVMQVLEHGIGVICEKPFMMNKAEAEAVFSKAKKKNTFTMEAMWSRFLPCIQKAHEWIVSGRIGTIKVASYIYGINVPPEHRIYNPDLGGGALWDLAVYPFEIVTYLMNQKLTGLQHSIRYESTGVDETDSLILNFEYGDAVMQATFHSRIPAPAGFFGTEGYILINMTHMASKVEMYDCQYMLVDSFEFPISNGFEFEIAHVCDCIRKGLIESPIMPWNATLECADMFDKCLKNCW